MKLKDSHALLRFGSYVLAIFSAACLVASIVVSAPWIWLLHDSSKYCEYDGHIARLYVVGARRMSASSRRLPLPFYSPRTVYHATVSYQYQREASTSVGNTYKRPAFLPFESSADAKQFLEQKFQEGQSIKVRARCNENKEYDDSYVEFDPRETKRQLLHAWLLWLPILLVSLLVLRIAPSAKRS